MWVAVGVDSDDFDSFLVFFFSGGYAWSWIGIEYHHVDGEGLLDANEVCGGMGGGYQGVGNLGNGEVAVWGRGTWGK